ncbi:MAG TPA: hypothetical protein LFW14_07110 [Rickettsia endosymbiont of Degeeriella rufa]|nr:hypothetical protein [Rickettsia endosymbiont of Degeeriella rufa]
MSDTKKVAINLNDSSDMFGGTKAMFTLLKSINNFNDIFSDQEVIVEDFYPSTHSNDIFTTAYNIIGFVGYYVCSYFWGSK